MADVKQALRLLLRRPAFTLLAVATLALGIGANAAIFSVVNGVLLRPLPYPQPDRLVRLWEHTSRSPHVNVSYPNLRDWRERLKSFDRIAGYQGGTTTVLGGGEPTFADAYTVTNGFFDVFKVAPALGRTFIPDEMTPGGPPTVVVSDRVLAAAARRQSESAAAAPRRPRRPRARDRRDAARLRISDGRRSVGVAGALAQYVDADGA